MKIRKAKSEDKSKFIKLAKKADQRPEYWSEKRFTKFIKEEDGLFLFVEDKGKLIGYVGLKKKDVEEKFKKINFNEFACIAWIAVLPEYRGKNVGLMLLKESEKYAKKWGKKGIWLDCRESVLGFYTKYNYKIKGYIMKENENGKKRRKYFLEKKLK
jgi:ribosomal protein S18 acetylase RimI-like enzyme